MNGKNWLKATVLVARDIPDAWFQCVRNNVKDSYRYFVAHGSYAGEESRSEFDDFKITITHPHVRPMEPDIPPGLNIPCPVEPGYLQTYYEQKIFTGVKDDNEYYVYGERLSGILIKRHRNKKTGEDDYEDPVIVGPNQIEKVIEIYKKFGPHTNQTTMEVGRPEDVLLGDPPCLRMVDTRLRYGKLHFFVYFRSWDLWNGFPVNLGALQLLKEYMAKEIGVEPGETIAYSKGLHIYKYAWAIAQLRVYLQNKEME
ncbi:MAG: thymidylate synthase [bacterium]